MGIFDCTVLWHISSGWAHQITPCTCPISSVMGIIKIGDNYIMGVRCLVTCI